LNEDTGEVSTKKNRRPLWETPSEGRKKKRREKSSRFTRYSQTLTKEKEGRTGGGTAQLEFIKKKKRRAQGDCARVKLPKKKEGETKSGRNKRHACSEQKEKKKRKRNHPPEEPQKVPRKRAEFTGEKGTEENRGLIDKAEKSSTP